MQAANAPGHGHKAARLNRMIQLALITGLTLSMLLMAVGALLYFLHNSTSSIRWMQAGLIVLMITPALRVLVAALGYVLERDWRFALISSGVVAVLVVSVLVGAS